MTMELKYASNVTTTETVTVTAPGALAPTFDLSQDQHNTTATLNATSTPPFTKASYFTKALVAGAATIDLTALTGPNGAVDGTGLKVQVMKVRNPSAAVITLSEGASNGYELLGNAWALPVPAGGEVTIKLNDTAPDIAGAAKTIDLAGTGTQSVNVFIGMG